MLRVLASSWALMLGVLLLMLGNGLQGTLLGVRGSLEHMNASTMGHIMSAYYIGFLGSSKLTPLLLKRVGHVRVFAALGSLVSAAFILFGAFIDPIAWWLLRLLVGFCFCGIYIVAESWVNHSANNDTRGQALSLYLIVQMGGIVLGQLLLNVADPAGYELFVLITVLVSVSFAPMLLSSAPAPLHETARAMPIRELINASPLACFGIFMLGGVFATLFAMAPVYATESGLSVRETSWFITAIFLGGMLLQYPIGLLSDRMDRRLLIIAVTAIAAVTAYAGQFFNHSINVLIAIAFILGGMSNPLYSLLIAHANDHLEYEQMAAASAGLLFMNGLGAMSGPIVVGYAMSQFGVEWFFINITLLMSAICLYGIYRITQRAPVASEDATSHVSLTSSTTSVAHEIAIEAADEAQLEAAEELDESDEVPDDHEQAVIERQSRT